MWFDYDIAPLPEWANLKNKWQPASPGHLQYTGHWCNHFACIRSILTTALSDNFQHLTNIILSPAHCMTCHSLQRVFQCCGHQKGTKNKAGFSTFSPAKIKAKAWFFFFFLTVNRKGSHSQQHKNVHINGFLEAPGTAAPEAESSGRHPKWEQFNHSVLIKVPWSPSQGWNWQKTRHLWLLWKSTSTKSSQLWSESVTLTRSRLGWGEAAGPGYEAVALSTKLR